MECWVCYCMHARTYMTLHMHDLDSSGSTCDVHDTDATVPPTGLYFRLRDTLYLSGATVPITNIGGANFEHNQESDSGLALVCVTSNVNTNCCRTSDGGNVGEWHFPNGTMVLRHSEVLQNGVNTRDFSRNGYTHEVRLNRHNTAALMPTGEYQCRVPDGNVANITIGRDNQ